MVWCLNGRVQSQGCRRNGHEDDFDGMTSKNTHLFFFSMAWGISEKEHYLIMFRLRFPTKKPRPVDCGLNSQLSVVCVEGSPATTSSTKNALKLGVSILEFFPQTNGCIFFFKIRGQWNGWSHFRQKKHLSGQLVKNQRLPQVEEHRLPQSWIHLELDRSHVGLGSQPSRLRHAKDVLTFFF